MGARDVYDDGGSLFVTRIIGANLKRESDDEEEDPSIEIQEMKVLGSEGEEDDEDLIQAFHRKRARTEVAMYVNPIAPVSKRSRTVPETKGYYDVLKTSLCANEYNTDSTDVTAVDSRDGFSYTAIHGAAEEDEVTLDASNELPKIAKTQEETDDESDDSIEILRLGEYKDTVNPEPAVQEVSTEDDDNDVQACEEEQETNNDDKIHQGQAMPQMGFQNPPEGSVQNAGIQSTLSEKLSNRQTNTNTPQTTKRPAKRKSTLIELCAKKNPARYRVGLSKRANVRHLHHYLSK